MKNFLINYVQINVIWLLKWKILIFNLRKLRILNVHSIVTLFYALLKVRRESKFCLISYLLNDGCYSFCILQWGPCIYTTSKCSEYSVLRWKTWKIHWRTFMCPSCNLSDTKLTVLFTLAISYFHVLPSKHSSLYGEIWIHPLKT
jgi:hypothetical protein